MSWISVALLSAALLAAPGAQAGLITTPEIVAASASLACLDYQVVGVCIWLDCHPFGCDITVTPKICHYLPDVVVSSYHRSEQNPWVEMSPLSASALAVGSSLMGGLLDGGVRSEGDGNRENKAMPFKEVSIIGNPAVGSTRAGEPHVYLPLLGLPSDEHTDRWQMLTPLVQPGCETFGSPDPLWSTGKVADDGGYAWNYWRRYQCCIPGPGVLIAEIDECPAALPAF